MKRIMAINYETAQMRNGLRFCVRRGMKLWGRILASSFFAVLALSIIEISRISGGLAGRITPERPLACSRTWGQEMKLLARRGSLCSLLQGAFDEG
jgi:hypothetical protein